jgi:hypothetical protein
MTKPCPTFGFLVVLEPAPGLEPAARDELRISWLAFLEGRGLCCTGGGLEARLEYLVSSEASQATNSDRVATQTWLSLRRDLRGWKVSELEDLTQAV